MHPLSDGEEGGADEQQAMLREHGETQTLPTRRDSMLLGKRLAHAFLQPSVGHPRGAGGLAATALHTGFHERHELGRDGCVVDVYGADGSDATPW